MFTHVGDARDAGSSGTSASVTHGLTINAGDLVVAHVNSNATDPVSPDADTGGTWTEHVDETPSGETGRQGLFSKIANGSEPATYSVTVGNAQWDLIVKVFRPSAGTPVVDAPATTAITPNNVHPVLINAIDGAVISDGAVSIVFGGKDNRSGADTLFSTADNSYVGVIGGTGFQEHAGAHRIYTTGQTFSGQVMIDAATGSQTDKCYSVHISFNDAAGGTAITAGTDSLTITEQNAGISLDSQISGGTDSLTISELQATLSLGKDISAGTDSLTITDIGAALSLDVDIAGGVQALTITEKQAAVVLQEQGEILAGTDTLTITDLRANIEGAGGHTARIKTGLMWI